MSTMSGVAYEQIARRPLWPHLRLRRPECLGRIGLLTVCAVTAAACAVLAPARLGGSLVYVVVDGSSMQPQLHKGDLVLVDTAAGGDYRVGEVVAYRNPQLGRIVLHRIVAESGARYLFKGDHNDFVDFYHPSRSDLIGRLWLRVPAAGSVLLWLRKPLHVGMVGLLLGLLLVSGSSKRRGRRRREDDRLAAPPPRPTGSPRSRHPLVLVLARAALALAALAGLGYALLTLIAYTHPVARTQARPGAYSQQGSYGYRALARPDSIYPGGRLVTGQTLFARLVHRVDLSFGYRLLSPLRHDLTGSAQLTAILRSGVGWRRTIASTKRLRFQGDRVALSLPLDLDRLEAQLGRYFSETGVPSDSFDLLLTATISLHGRLAGQPLQTSFAPQPLDFVLDKYTLRLSDSPGAGAGPGQASADPLHPSATGTLTQREPVTLNLFGKRARVGSVRRLGLVGLLAAALLALLTGGLLRTSRLPDELGRIRRRYGHAILTVAAPPPAPKGGYVEVTSFDSLAHLAATLERVILHHQQPNGHSFYLEDDGSLYRYQLSTCPPPQQATALGA